MGVGVGVRCLDGGDMLLFLSCTLLLLAHSPCLPLSASTVVMMPLMPTYILLFLF